MGVLQAAGIGILSSVLILCLKELRGALAPTVRVASTLLLFGAAALLYGPIVGRIGALFEATGAAEHATPLLRATGIALICELAAVLCRDMGENGVANGILLFGKLEILVLALPLVDAVLEIAKELLNF